MANIINNNFHNLRLTINKDEYIDFFLNKDESLNFNMKNGLKEDCLISYIDTNDPDCLYFDDMLSKSDYVWDGCINNGVVFKNIGYTGIDNGLIIFRKDKITNNEFLKIFTESELTINPDDCRLKLKKVSGNTMEYIYPCDIIYENNIQTVKLNGGFYQGFFKTDKNTYQVLPTSINHEWAFEFVLKKENYEHPNGKILNDTYPENKGFFFYIGTRAENKWYKYYSLKETNTFEKCDVNSYFNPEYITDGDYETNKDEIVNADWFIDGNDYVETTDFIEDPNSDYFKDNEYLEEYKTESVNKSLYFGEDYVNDGYIDLSQQDRYFIDKDYIQNDIKIDFSYNFTTSENRLLNQQSVYEFETDNKFILFNRTPTGFTVNNFNEEDTTIVLTGVTENEVSENYFILFNRTPTGHTTETYNRETSNMKKYDVVSDVVRNALGFRIDDNGRIGYRYITSSCETDNRYEVVEEYSFENIIEESKWYVIDVRLKTLDNGYDLICNENKKRKMKIYIYVNGKLKLISKEIDCLLLKDLQDTLDKQESVPYNISLGGGSQGLIESIYPNYYYSDDNILPIEKNFAGSFIGEFKSFKFYDCPLNYYEISNNIDFERNLLK